jgi:hypothetical protein
VKTRISFCVLIGMAAALLIGCTEMFEYNLGKRKAEVTISPDTTVDELKALAELPDFYTGLTAEKKQEVLEFLDEKLASEDKNEVRDAALIKAEIYLKTDPKADQTVSNLVNLLFTQTNDPPGGGSGSPDGEEDPEAELKSQLEAILPPAVVPPQSAAPGSTEYNQAKNAFKETIISLANAGTALRAFGEALEQSDDGTYTAPDDVEIASVAQTAAICIATEILLDIVAREDSDEADKAAKVEEIFDYLYGGSENSPFEDETPDFTGGLKDSAALRNIIEAAGFSIESIIGGASDTEGGEL